MTNEEEKSGSYTTADLYLAAYLVTRGGEWTDTDESTERVKFVITMTHEAYTQACEEFQEHDYENNVNVRAYVLTVKNMKRAFRKQNT